MITAICFHYMEDLRMYEAEIHQVYSLIMMYFGLKSKILVRKFSIHSTFAFHENYIVLFFIS